ncbi:MAG TPA: hypothetical protein VEJ67_18005 [Candidatus Cybelea sp.]|nr:hypothetical protein [Candidatus Cybelea sp.]
MYFWKYWRDTRRGVFVYLGLLVLLAILWLYSMYRANRLGHMGGDARTLWIMELGVTFGLTYLCAVVMSFVAGSHNVGADIGKGTGDFLLSRPRSRKYFVWAGWMAGVCELLGLLVFTALFVFALNVGLFGPVWRQLPSPAHVRGLDLPLMGGTLVLTAGLVYGLTFFLGVLWRSGQRGVIWSVAILFAYSVLSALLRQFEGISLPTPNLVELTSYPAGPWYLGLRIEIIGWTLLSLAFPFAAQLVLDRSDV